MAMFNTLQMGRQRLTAGGVRLLRFPCNGCNLFRDRIDFGFDGDPIDIPGFLK